MEYRRFDHTILARLDRGEELLEQLGLIAQQEHLTLAAVSGLGAVDEVTAGVYDAGKQEYLSNRFSGYYEIVSLTGTINTFHGEYYAHLHISIADLQGCVVGGHLNRARISATCELVITVLPGHVDQRHDEDVGLNVFQFD